MLHCTGLWEVSLTYLHSVAELRPVPSVLLPLLLQILGTQGIIVGQEVLMTQPWKTGHGAFHQPDVSSWEMGNWKDIACHWANCCTMVVQSLPADSLWMDLKLFPPARGYWVLNHLHLYPVSRAFHRVWLLGIGLSLLGQQPLVWQCWFLVELLPYRWNNAGCYCHRAAVGDPWLREQGVGSINPLINNINS